MSLFSTVFSYCLVGLLWGTTNPFIKYGQAIFKQKKMRLLQQEYDEQQKQIEHQSEAEYASSSSTKRVSDSEKISTMDSMRLMFSEPLVYLPFIVNQRYVV
jgi:hypothetical protein